MCTWEEAKSEVGWREEKGAGNPKIVLEAEKGRDGKRAKLGF